MTSNDLDVLDEPECRQLLRDRTFGRVGVQIGTELAVLPVYYAIVDDDIVFRTSPGTKLTAALVGARVAFEIDNPSPGWSVLIPRPRPRTSRRTSGVAGPGHARTRLAGRRA